MQTIYLHMPRQRGPCPIDITPLPWWRRAARAGLALLTFLVAVPLLWLLGSLFALVILVGGAAMLAYLAIRASGRTTLSSSECQHSVRHPG